MLAEVAIFIILMRLRRSALARRADVLEHGHGFPIRLAHWMDVAIPVGLAGVWMFLFARQLRSRPLLPLNDPFFKEAFAHDVPLIATDDVRAPHADASCTTTSRTSTATSTSGRVLACAVGLVVVTAVISVLMLRDCSTFLEPGGRGQRPAALAAGAARHADAGEHDRQPVLRDAPRPQLLTGSRLP